MNKADLIKGQEVLFGRPNGEKTRGEIVKLNPKKAKIKQLDNRGTHRNYPIGTVWAIPYSLIFPANGEAQTTTTHVVHTPSFGSDSFSTGDRVYFFDKGLKVTGTVKRVNRKTISVDPDGRSDGRYYRVPPSMLSKDS